MQKTIKNKTVLLTGATGFIGSHSIEPLINLGFEVHAITSKNQAQKKTHSNLKWHYLDLFNFVELDKKLSEIKPSYLLHYAWYTEHGKFWNSVENYKWMDATINLVKRFIFYGGQRFVISGSCAEYEWKHSKYVEGITPCLPENIYGKVKNLTRLAVEKIATDCEVSYSWGRIFFLYGYGEKSDRLVPSAINSLLQGKHFKCSHGAQLRDYMHIQDAASAFAALLNSNINGAVNIASGISIEVRQIVNLVASYIGAKDLVAYGAIEARNKEPGEITADIQILTNMVGFQCRHRLQEGIYNMIDRMESDLNEGA
jgi:UDP-glucuronate decarboxylase